MANTFFSNDYIHNMSDSCGYTDYIETYLTFPPPEVFPVKLPGTNDKGHTTADCDVFNTIVNEVFNVNPCWDIYQVATTCPELWDVLGFPGSFDYVPAGANIYFNRTDVQKAINAPPTNWAECTNTNVFVNGTDNSLPSGLSVLPGVIERSKRTIIGHGALDMVLISNGTLLMIQNMTWNGAQGFTSKPSDPFYVPYHNDLSLSTVAAQGVFGTTHTERGLTWVSVDLSGHSKSLPPPISSFSKSSKSNA
jgi:carboxypeptidase D